MTNVFITLAHISFRLLCIVVFLCNIFVISFYTYHRFEIAGSGYGGMYPLHLWQKIGLISTILFLLLTVLVLYWPEKRKTVAVPPKRRIYRRFFTVISVSFFLFLLVDCKVPREQFTINDITSTDPVMQQSTVLINKLYYGENDDIPDLKFIRDSNYARLVAHEAEIQNAWQMIADQRIIVTKLVSYDKVLLDRQAEIFESKEIYARRIAYIFHSYSLLLAKKGDVQGAVESLILFHNASRKGFEGSVSILQKMIWTYIIKENLRTAFQLMYEHQPQEELLAKLTKTFHPLSLEESSFFKPWIGEKENLKKKIDLPFVKTMEAKFYKPEAYTTLYNIAKKLPQSFVDGLFRLILQKNRSTALVVALWEPIIEKSKRSVTSADIVDLQKIFSSLPLRNVGGWIYHYPPQYWAYEKRVLNLKIMSGLFSKYIDYTVRGQRSPSLSTYGFEFSNSIDGELRALGHNQLPNMGEDLVLEVYYKVEKNRND